jgi:hypothetical protein
MKLQGTLRTSFVLTGRFLLELDLGIVNPSSREINELCEMLNGDNATVTIERA